MIGDECIKELILNQESGCFKFIEEFINQRIHINSAFLGAFLTVEVILVSYIFYVIIKERNLFLIFRSLHFYLESYIAKNLVKPKGF